MRIKKKQGPPQSGDEGRDRGGVESRFVEGRFKAQVLLDEAAMRACLQYQAMNPIRAGLAKTLEGSDFASVQDGIEDLKQAEDGCAAAATKRSASRPRAGCSQESGTARAVWCRSLS